MLGFRRNRNGVWKTVSNAEVIIINGEGGWLWTLAAYRRTHSLSQVAWSEGRRPLGAVLHSSKEPNELSQ